MRRLLSALAFLALAAGAAPAAAIDGTDEGTYIATRSQRGQAIRTFRLARSGDAWSLTERRADGSFTPLTCSASCDYRRSEDVSRFFPADSLAQIVPDCVNNSVFAFCRYSLVDDPKFRGYVLVVLGEAEPFPVRLARVDRPGAAKGR
jgi:hypothetical protein